MYRGENHGNAGAREYTIPSSRGAATIYTSYGRIQQPAQQQQQHASTRSTARELQNAGAQLGTWLGEFRAPSPEQLTHQSSRTRKRGRTLLSAKVDRQNAARSAISQLALGGLGNSKLQPDSPPPRLNQALGKSVGSLTRHDTLATLRNSLCHL